MDADPDLVTVAAFDTAIDASTARACLGAAGIVAVIQDAELLTVDPLLTLAVGRITLQVRRVDAAEARERIDEWQERRSAAAAAAAEEPEDAEDDGTTSCLACDARIPAYIETCPACGWSYT